MGNVSWAAWLYITVVVAAAATVALLVPIHPIGMHWWIKLGVLSR